MNRIRILFPFTARFILVLAVFGVLFYLLYSPAPDGKNPDLDTSPTEPFILLMAKVALLAGAGLVLLSLVSALLNWAYFLALKSRGTDRVEISFDKQTDRKTGNYTVLIQAVVRGALRPLLGFVTGRLVYDDGDFTAVFPLLGSRRKRVFLLQEAVKGGDELTMGDVKEYRINGAFVFFQDMLRMLSLPAHQRLSGTFQQLPRKQNLDITETNPRHTETLDVRIDKMKRVEGDLFQYKSFESGDDVRRIVWKVYARNRDLVVRTPERFEPFASHLYFYAGFNANIPFTLSIDNPYFREGLNFYKERVWTVYSTLKQSQAEVRFVPDQQFQPANIITAEDQVLQTISRAAWHDQGSLTEYFDARKGAVLIISSLSDPDQVQEVIENSNNNVVVYFVPLSKAFRHSAALHWAGRLFLRPSDDRIQKLRSSWPFSPVRAFLRKREAAIQAILDNSLAPIEIL
jgi:hypothetical protein